MLELGYEIEGKELDALFWRFKSVAEKKKKITDDDLIALMSDEVFQPQFVWQLQNVQVTCGNLDLSTATVKLIDADGQEYISCSVETGPVDLIVKLPVTLLEYSMNAVTQGIDAIASTRVLIHGENGHTSTHALTGESVHRTFSGTGADMDIVISSVRAYVGALNRMMSFRKLLAKNNKPEGSAVI